MISNRTYRRIVAALLLALYCFIATPVQCWHHHSTVSSAIGSLADDDDCPVCSHQYAVYHEPTPLAFDLSMPTTPVQKIRFHQPLIATPGYSTSNKGPPALA